MNSAVALALGIASGFALGLGHFLSLRHAVGRILAGSFLVAFALQMLRMATLAAALVGLAFVGTLPLLGAGFGLALARCVVLRRLNGALPDAAQLSTVQRGDT